MVRVGVFGTKGELNMNVSKLLIDELLDKCCDEVGADEVESVVSHASGMGIGEYVFEAGSSRDVTTVGMVLPSCRAEQWYPVDELVYVGDVWGEQAVSDCSSVLDIIVWVGDVSPKRDWLELSNLSDVYMLSVSDSILDWTAPSATIELDDIVDELLQYQYP